MNRMFLTAVATIATIVSSHAMAATYTLDDFSDDQMLTSDVGHTVQTIGATGAFGRTVSFESDGPDNSLFIGSGFMFLSHENTGGGALTLGYDLSSQASNISGHNVTVGFSVVSSDADFDTPTTVTALLGGTQVGSWTLSTPVSSDAVAGSISFAAGNSNALTLVINGSPGYDFALGTPITLDVSPVPEPGEWAMLGAGLAVAGFAARRRKAA